MLRLPKIFLAISVTALIVGLTDFGGSLVWGILRPLSAVSFILFFLTNLLGREMQRYDAENRLKGADSPGDGRATASRSFAITPGGLGKNSSPAAASSH